MKEFVVRAPAKVNLSLDVLGKRADGYHEMRMVNHTIALADTLVFCKKDSGIGLSCSTAEVPGDQRNLVYRMAEALKDRFGITQGVHIDIMKQIPSQAGLAGGSSDAAATLLGLNQIWNLGMSLPDMYTLGSAIGADIPYCCFKGMALVEGIGEIIKPIKPLRKTALLVVKPNINIATPWAFGKLDNAESVEHPDIDQVVGLVETEAYDQLGGSLGNAFEQVVFEVYPEIKAIKEKLLKIGAFAAIMSGSGSTVIGYFNDRSTAENAYGAFMGQYALTFLTETE